MRTLKSALPRKCNRFNGSSGLVTVPITPSTTAFSFAFWIALERPSISSDRILDWMDSGPSNGFDLEITTNTTNPRFFIRNGAGAQAQLDVGSLVIGKKYFIVCTFDATGAGTATVYRDGTQVAQDTSCTIAAATQTLTLGRRSAGSTNFARVKMGNFMFFNDVALSLADIQALYTNGTVPTGCTVYYDFENDVLDNSGNANDGTATAPDYELFTNPVRSLNVGSNRALNFSGVANANVSISDDTLLRFETTAEFTLFNRLFVTKLDESDLPRVFAKGGHYNCWMGDESNSRYRNIGHEFADNNGAGAVEYWGGTQMEHRGWYDVATVGFASGASVVHYLNGVPEHMTILAGPMIPPITSTSGDLLFIGNSPGQNRNTGGYIKDTRQHNVALDESEINQLRTGTNVTRGLVGKWDMTEGSGATIADTSGNNFHGQIANATWVTVNTRTAVSSRSDAGSRTGV